MLRNKRARGLLATTLAGILFSAVSFVSFSLVFGGAGLREDSGAERILMIQQGVELTMTFLLLYLIGMFAFRDLSREELAQSLLVLATYNALIYVFNLFGGFSESSILYLILSLPTSFLKPISRIFSNLFYAPLFPVFGAPTYFVIWDIVCMLLPFGFIRLSRKRKK